MTTYVDPSVLDIDFRKHPRFVFGYTGDPKDRMFAAPRFGESIPVLPESKWREEIEKIESAQSGLEYNVTRVYDQDGEGSCVANATGQAHEILQCRQFGPHNVTHLSAISLYKRIGRSPNSGSSISDALDETLETGILPLDNAENRALGYKVMPNIGFRERFPDDWQVDAKEFRFQERYILGGLDEAVTASIMGFAIVVGRAGHSICYVRATYSQRNSLVFGYVNSWGDWGQGWGNLPNGFGFDSGGLLRSATDWCWAVRAVRIPRHLAPKIPQPPAAKQRPHK